MPLVSIDKKISWECQRCGVCCRDFIMSKQENLSIKEYDKETDKEFVRCKHLDNENNTCSDYENRPFICKIYPFVVDYSKMLGPDGVARPSIAFSLENMKIHSECPGYGKGKRIKANKNLLRKFEKLCHRFSLDLKKVHNKEMELSELI